MRSSIRSTHRATARQSIASGDKPSAPWLNDGTGQWIDIGDGRRLGV